MFIIQFLKWFLCVIVCCFLSGCCIQSAKPIIKPEKTIEFKDGRCYRIVSGYLLTDQDLASYTDQDLADSNDQWVKLPCLKTYLPMVNK